jgi:SNF2 family DNA or RNA helicase
VLDVADETSSKIIIWARFRAEIVALTNILNSVYGKGSAVAFYGDVKTADKNEAIDLFQDPESKVRFFVAQQHSGGYGLTLTAASYVIYYSNDFSLEARLQSEDRCHRIGQRNPVTYIDLECLGTIDSRIINALREKKKLADTITRDDPSTWL